MQQGGAGTRDHAMRPQHEGTHVAVGRERGGRAVLEDADERCDPVQDLACGIAVTAPHVTAKAERLPML